MAKKKNLLNVKVRAGFRESQLEVRFGFFDIYPDIYVDVTEDIKAMDKSDLEKVLSEEDIFLDTSVVMELPLFTQKLEDLGMRLAEALRDERDLSKLS
jgi:hypothetical protein